MPDSSATEAPAASDSAWHARLALGFEDDAGVTRLVERSHCGPLRVQKPLYPEGGAVCHAIVVHPPGGVVGGDQLAVSARVGRAAHAFLTSPGAAKWYKANGKISRQRIDLSAGDGASIEWMPQESIFFDQAHVALEQTITLAPDATYIGCEILCLGRSASGESFNSGAITQRTQIRRGGKLIWWEQGALAGGGALLRSPLGLHGHSVCATLIAVGQQAPAALLAAVRAIAVPPGSSFGASQVKGLLVLRYLGDDSEQARRVMLAAWQLLRPFLLDRAAVVPRIWNT
ncbi:urease accessory protein UreD [Janthinobacterium agaricidamnosum]|uniref:Urease accessory protein UreD n=1 Tax=Janthinobacterium agaricidamnosum NBRC 102515 = DSM 9628 TaxID=1349767 RepID=W0V842_9BURK|nr:urease accessory protein UreD [Janthinobacterium agaricidamnosum]CDG83508.1 ureD urease accessory family protein [Janthinobacterium agaricidamnosum NBRC 102515 = DSM 9628]